MLQSCHGIKLTQALKWEMVPVITDFDPRFNNSKPLWFEKLYQPFLRGDLRARCTRRMQRLLPEFRLLNLAAAKRKTQKKGIAYSPSHLGRGQYVLRYRANEEDQSQRTLVDGRRL